MATLINNLSICNQRTTKFFFFEALNIFGQLINIEKWLKIGDNSDMNDFFKGIASIGQLFPPPIAYDQYLSPYSSWQSVANSFNQAGNSIWIAINEFENDQCKEQQ